MGELRFAKEGTIARPSRTRSLPAEKKKSLRILFTNKPLIRTEAEKIIPICNDNEEVLDYLKELLKLEKKKSLRILFTNKPLIRTEAEKIIPICNDNEEVLDYLKELLKLVQQLIPSQDVVVVDPVIKEPSFLSSREPEKFENNLQPAETFEKKCINELPHNPISASEENPVGTYLPETTRINKQSHNLLVDDRSSETNNLQITGATEKTFINKFPYDPISTSNYLPDTTSQPLQYYGQYL
ncbi:hypothetical protein Glove_120g36 [Diversispora epigaea]|uniref:Uncharacterized protein n=1 Tax=Diversispora epigaea TaxID=1348612 RepID=A0A397J3H5_9GLOM|nr:hypothetical protein Glove_120g36 [Diversispora epigaea]